MRRNHFLRVSIQRVLHFGGSFLYSCEKPHLEAEVLLAHALGQSRLWVTTHREEAVSVAAALQFLWWCFRRGRGVPVAYILGEKEWAGFCVCVDRHVLIPRDETEVLMEHVATWAQGKTIHSFLDVGTGSGIIALWLSRHLPHAKGMAVDVSKKALKVARQNAQRQNASIQFVLSHLLSAVPQGQSFDVIVANLPYVPATMPIAREVQKEPALALFSGGDGLDLLRRFASELDAKHIRFQALFLEFLPTQIEAVTALFQSYGFQVFPLLDVSGRPFFVRVEPRLVPEKEPRLR